MVFGWIFAGHQIGAATAAFGAGLIRTEYSTYLPAFFISGALCIIAAALVLTVRKSSPRHRSVRGSPGAGLDRLRASPRSCPRSSPRYPGRRGS